ncbi:hypothetical protein AB0O31_03230 [Kitasatospora cineracea]|uniref:hypothetical protein n=1 Tax=Kitasatospora cineracea TaxID=88074 RepID=UPI003420064C
MQRAVRVLGLDPALVPTVNLDVTFGLTVTVHAHDEDGHRLTTDSGRPVEAILFVPLAPERTSSPASSRARAGLLRDVVDIGHSQDVIRTTAPLQGGGDHLGDPNCPNRSTHGSPHRYCECGWIEPEHAG